MADIKGPGAIQQIWMTPAGQLALRHPALLLGRRDRALGRVPRRRLLRLRLGQVRPDLVAARLRQPRQRVQLLLGDALPQGLQDHHREPRRRRSITVYYQINYTLTEVPDDAAYFHAQFRRVNPLPYKEVYTILDGVKGRGHYVGTYMAWGVNNNGWWGEGEIKFFLDGDTEFPTICGTGTEDYFCGSYNFDAKAPDGSIQYHEFTTPYTGSAAGHPRRTGTTRSSSGSACTAGTSWTRSASRRT